MYFPVILRRSDGKCVRTHRADPSLLQEQSGLLAQTGGTVSVEQHALSILRDTLQILR